MSNYIDDFRLPYPNPAVSNDFSNNRDEGFFLEYNVRTPQAQQMVPPRLPQPDFERNIGAARVNHNGPHNIENNRINSWDRNYSPRAATVVDFYQNGTAFNFNVS